MMTLFSLACGTRIVPLTSLPKTVFKLSTILCLVGAISFPSVRRLQQHRASRLSLVMSTATKATTQVEIYSTAGCSYCRRAKARLEQLCVPYLTIDVSDPSTVDAVPSSSSSGCSTSSVSDTVGTTDSTVLFAIRAARHAHARRNTVPQIYVGYPPSVPAPGATEDGLTRVGGHDELIKELEEGAFQRRMGGTMPEVVPVPVPTSSAAPTVGQTPATPVTAAMAAMPAVAPRPPISILNTPPARPVDVSAGGEGPLTSLALSQALQRRALLLTDTFATPDGARVDYQAMRGSEPFAQVRPIAPRLLFEAAPCLPACLFPSVIYVPSPPSLPLSTAPSRRSSTAPRCPPSPPCRPRRGWRCLPTCTTPWYCTPRVCWGRQRCVNHQHSSPASGQHSVLLIKT